MMEKILITGASYDGLNRNVFLRDYVAEGFIDVLGEGNVRAASLEYINDVTQAFVPDVFLLFGTCMPDDVSYYSIRKLCDDLGALLVFWLHDDPYEFDYNYKILDVSDVIFSNDKWASIHYDHEYTYHMPLAASPDHHYRPVNNNYLQDLFFCGVGFSNRIQLFSDLQSIFSKYNTVILGDNWPDSFPDYVKNQRINNNELVDYYASSKFVINVGRNFNFANDKYNLTASTPGPRTFEAAMAGAVQLYFVESLEVEEYFDDGEEILLFDSRADFKDKVDDLVKNPDELLRLRKAAQSRAVSDHTYKNRAIDIIDILDRHKS